MTLSLGKPEAAVDTSTLTTKENEIYDVILQHWPTSALEVAEHFSEPAHTRKEKRQVSTKYSYYIKKLIEKRFIFSKKAGNATIVWPLVVEKYRTIHDMLRD